MIYVDVLINNPERDKKILSKFSRKIKKTIKNLAKLAAKIRKVVQSREFIYSNHLNLYSNDRYSTSDYESRNIFKKTLVLWYSIDIPDANLNKFA